MRRIAVVEDVAQMGLGQFVVDLGQRGVQAEFRVPMATTANTDQFSVTRKQSAAASAKNRLGGHFYVCRTDVLVHGRDAAFLQSGLTAAVATDTADAIAALDSVIRRCHHDGCDFNARPYDYQGDIPLQIAAEQLAWY